METFSQKITNEYFISITERYKNYINKLYKLIFREPLSTSDKITKIVKEHDKLAKNTTVIDNDEFIEKQLNIARENFINKLWKPITED